MTDQEMEKLLCERYAEFHRHEDPDSVIRRFNDYGYFKALEEAQNLKTEQIPGTFFSSGNPEGIIREIFARAGRLVCEEDVDGVHRIIGLLPHNVHKKREERILHPPALFVCWTKNNELYFVARGKNPPGNPNALREATDLFLEEAEAADGQKDLPEETPEKENGDALTSKQKTAMGIIGAVVAVLVVVFLAIA